MSDFMDRAADREQEIRSDQLLEQQRRAGLDHRTTADSAHFCADCEEAIPQARRQAYPGVNRCVACQSRKEWSQARAR